MAAIVDVAAIKIRPDLSTFRSELRAALSKVNVDLNIPVTLDVDTSEASARLAAFRGEESTKDINQGVDIDTSALQKAQLALAGIGRNSASSSGGLNILGKAFGLVTGKVGLFAVAGQVAIPAIAAIGPLVVQAAGAVALLPAAFAGGIATMAAFKLGADGIKAAFTQLTPTLDALKKAVSSSFQSALIPAVNNLKTILPGLKTGFQEIATALGGIAVKVTSAFKTPPGIAQLNTLLDGTSRVIQNVGKAVAPLVQAFVNVANIGLQAILPLTAGFGSAAQSVLNFTTSASGIAKIQGFISGAFSAIQQLGTILGQIGTIALVAFRNISAGAGGVGASFAPALSAVASFVQSAQGIAALQSVGQIVAGVGQAFGGVLTTALQAVTPLLVTIAPIITQLAGILGGALTPVITVVGQLLQQLVPVASALMPVFSAIGQAVATLAPTLGTLLSGAIAAITPILSALVQAVTPLLPPIQSLISALVPPLVALFNQLSPILSQTASLLGTVLASAIAAISPLFPPLVQIIQALLPPILQLVNALLPPLAQLFDAVAPIITLVAQVVAQLIGALAPLIPPITQLISTLLPPLISLFTSILKPILSLVSALLGPLTGAISSIVGAVGKLLGVFGNLLGGLANAASSVIGWFSGLGSKIFGAIGDLVGRFVQFGVDLLTGLARGIASAIGAVISKVKEVAGKVVSGIKSFLGIGSPSKVMAKDVGRWIPAGIGVGIAKYANLATDPFDSLVSSMDARGFQSLTGGGATSVVNGVLQVQSGGIEAAVERGLSRAQFSLDSRGIATITATGAALNYPR